MFAFPFAVAMAYCVQPAFAQLSIGSAALIKNDVQGVRGPDTRVLATGGSVFSDDQVKTGDDSVARLVFLDQTALTVAPNSQAVLREVYRPQQGLGQLVMKTVTGSFRFVSGAQSAHNYEVQFPQGYLTVRGTTVDLLAGPARSLVVLVEGSITVVANATGNSRDLSAPGTSLIVYNDGHMDGPLSRAAAINRLRLPSNQFASTMWAALEANPGTPVPACDSKPPFLPWGGTGSATITVSGGKACGIGWHDTGATILDSMTVASPPSHGTLKPQDQHVIVFTPAPGYKGQDSFTLSMREHNGGRSATLRVRVSVTIQ
jgi:hypothetical protein